ncbi:hypothetical protein EVAR_20241_1 [Eumeta japonica]|uniref:Uncharacterized protein n=1 Tax=Eumeta variegata TaxID=151549 RepID=A0A4C1WAR1_EUMVA|nr:hypothetical protein EVAR_20241_1 [Eumeta japonica]
MRPIEVRSRIKNGRADKKVRAEGETSRCSPPPTDTRKPGEVTYELPAFRVGIGFLLEWYLTHFCGAANLATVRLYHDSIRLSCEAESLQLTLTLKMACQRRPSPPATARRGASAPHDGCRRPRNFAVVPPDNE